MTFFFFFAHVLQYTEKQQVKLMSSLFPLKYYIVATACSSLPVMIDDDLNNRLVAACHGQLVSFLLVGMGSLMPLSLN